ncbi:hypothetical protein D9758_004294 [Tetrapyrgos nigripes]|uniref:Mucoidy inhibitor A n=1 Tax=Tetrapyrgos nigripes TaxID=182062 RepID=A0A8H5GU42_9AGAR|nr:hypothetical protein D9758_004294 [Tetrapyrgos nigripes]
MTTDTPTEPQIIQLNSLSASTIRNVTLYPARAEVTRVFKFAVNAGQTKVQIDGLPTVMDRESLRVDGVGDATIHDVTISNIPTPPTTTNSTLDSLRLEKERTQYALDRCKRSLSSLETLFGTMNIQHVDVSNLSTIMKSYDSTGEELDEKVIELVGKMKEIEEKIKSETEAQGQKTKTELNIRVSVVVVAGAAGDVELVLTYACKNVSKRYWRAGYDIRVDMSSATDGKQTVTLVYKAVVTQSTGEPWENVPLTLDTTTPTYGAKLPVLDPWYLEEQVQYVYSSLAKRKSAGFGGGGNSNKESRSVSFDARPHIAQDETIHEEEKSDRVDFKYGSRSMLMPFASALALKKPTSQVTSKGSVNATFRVPGFVTIPSASSREEAKDSDSGGVDHEHTFSITELELDAVVTWAVVPKKEARVMFKAKIVNSSEYTLLNGKASVYVDGSFISQIDVPLISPLESFDCPLGYDPTIRVTYHPLRKKVTTTGFYSKTKEHLFTQTISIQNTKTISIPALKVIDQIPVSAVGAIKVNLINPGLTLPDPAVLSSIANAAVAGTSASGVGVGANGADADEGLGDDQVSEVHVNHARSQSLKSTNRLSIAGSYFTSKAGTGAGSTITSAAPNGTPASPAAPKVKLPGYNTNVIAQWEGTDELETQTGGESKSEALERLGKDGKLEWVCQNVPPMGGETALLDLVLQYEIKVPAKMNVKFFGVRGE